jgi:hypothetical protein
MNDETCFPPGRLRYLSNAISLVEIGKNGKANTINSHLPAPDAQKTSRYSARQNVAESRRGAEKRLKPNGIFRINIPRKNRLF